MEISKEDLDKIKSLTREDLEKLSDEELKFIDEALSSAPAPAKIKYSPFETAVLHGLQGATMTWGDEIAGFIEAGLTDKTYEQARDENRKILEKSGEQNPTTATVSSVVGGLGTMALLPGGALKNLLFNGYSGAMLSGAFAGAGSAEEIKDIPLEAAKGAAIGGAFATLPKIFKRAPKEAAAVAQEAAEEAKPLVQQTLEKLQEVPNKFPGMEEVLNVVNFKNFKIPKEFKEEILEKVDVANEFLQNVAKVSGNKTGAGINEGTLKEIWDTTVKNKQILRTAEEAQAFVSKEAAQVEKVASNKVAAFFLSTKQFADKIDDAVGTEFGKAVTDIHKALNNTKIEVAERITGFKDALEGLPVAKTLREKINFVKEAEQNGNALTEAFERERLHLNANKGYNISKVAQAAHYLPNQYANKPVIYAQIKEALDNPELLEEAQKAMYKLGIKDQKNPKEALKRWFDSSESFTPTLQRANSRLLQRDSEVPVLLRELDPKKLAVSYLNGVYKSANLRVPLLELGGQAKLLAQQGLKESAAFVQDYGRTLTKDAGIVPGLWNRGKESFQRAVTDSLGTGASAETLRQVPDFIESLASNVHATYLGLPNLVTPVRNLAQTLSMTAPELGGVYGYKAVLKGVKDLVTGGLSKSKEDLKKIGMEVTHNRFEIEEPTVAGVRKVNELLLSLHSLTDEFNRGITLGAAKNVVKDVAAGVPEALAALQRAPKSVQGRVRFNLANGNVAAAEEELAKHLIAKTQFIYGKEGRTQLSRTLGPVLTMFTKYPTEIFSDIWLNPMNLRTVEKHLAPLLAVYAGNWALDSAGAFDSKSTKRFLGSSIMSMAPVTSISPTNLSAPPAAKLTIEAMSVADELLRTGKVKRNTKDLKKAITPFVPVYGAYLNAVEREKRLSKP